MAKYPLLAVVVPRYYFVETLAKSRFAPGKNLPHQHVWLNMLCNGGLVLNNIGYEEAT